MRAAEEAAAAARAELEALHATEPLEPSVADVDGEAEEQRARLVAAEAQLAQERALLSDPFSDVEMYKGTWTEEGHVDVAQLLLEAKADANPSHMTDDDTPLIMAAEQGCEEFVRLLLKWKADVDQTKMGRTPLQLALANEHAGVVELLRKVGVA